MIGLLALYLRTALVNTQYDYGGQMCKVNAFIAIYMNWTRKLTSNRVQALSHAHTDVHMLPAQNECWSYWSISARLKLKYNYTFVDRKSHECVKMLVDDSKIFRIILSRYSFLRILGSEALKA